jgi:hypothetical protein
MTSSGEEQGKPKGREPIVGDWLTFIALIVVAFVSGWVWGVYAVLHGWVGW